MKVNEAFKSILSDKGISQYKLSEIAEENYVAFNRKLNWGNPKLETLLEIVKLLNGELVIKVDEKEYIINEFEKRKNNQ